METWLNEGQARLMVVTARMIQEALEKDKMEPVVKDLGWANGWSETPEIVERCKERGHHTSDIDMGPPFRGIDHVVRCDICGYVYHYDSSD